MEPISPFLLTALGYILKGAAQSKTAQDAKEEVLGRFWGWIRPRLIKDVPYIEEEPRNSGDSMPNSRHTMTSGKR